MSDIIFLQPVSSLPADVTTLAQECRNNMMSHLRCNFIDEVLSRSEDNKVFTSKNDTWLGSPKPRIVTVDDQGVETLRFKGTDYSLSLTGGVVTFSSPVTDIVKASYSAYPWSDPQVIEFTKAALSEIQVLIWRDIDENDIHPDYRAAICRRTYTKLLEDLMGESKDFYSISVSGRSINKESILTQTSELIKQNETQLADIIESLRHYNRTNRVTPSFVQSKSISSDAEVQ